MSVAVYIGQMKVINVSMKIRMCLFELKFKLEINGGGMLIYFTK